MCLLDCSSQSPLLLRQWATVFFTSTCWNPAARIQSSQCARRHKKCLFYITFPVSWPAEGKSRGTAPCKLSLNLFLALLHLQVGEMCRCVCWWCLKTGIIESRQRVLAQTLQHIFPSSMASKAFAQPWWHPERWWASQNHPWSIVKSVLESFISLFLSFSSIWTLTNIPTLSILKSSNLF